MRNTLRDSIDFTGVGLHSGTPARLRISPASGEYGIWIKRIDGVDGDPMIPARYDAVCDTQLCTRLANRDGVAISTIEHVMAALAGCGVDDALLEIDGPEMPIMDGSSKPFAEAIRATGLRRVTGETRVIRVVKPVEVIDGERLARLEPADRLEIDFGIDFQADAIGRQEKSLTMVNGAFMDHLQDARTFCLKAEIDQMRAMGLARGGSLANAVVVDGTSILNPEGLRHTDEFVRHKMLDAVGDLALAGAPLLARYVGRRSGHEMTNRLLRALFAQPDAWRFETLSGDADLLQGLRSVAA